MVGEDDSYFGKGDLFFFLCNRFPDRVVAKSASPFRWRRGELVRMRIYIHIMKRWLAVSLSGVADRKKDDEASGIRGARGKHPGDETSRMRGARGKHLGDEASRMRGARGKHPD